MAGGQYVGVVGTEGGRGRHHCQLLDTRCLSRHGGHQYGGWIRGCSAGNTDPDTPQWDVTLLQENAVRAANRHVLMQNGPLKLQDIVANPSNGLQQLRLSLTVCCLQSRPRHTQHLARHSRTVQLLAVPQDRSDSLLPHIFTNRLHNLLGRQLTAKHLHRLGAAPLADHISLGTQFVAQSLERRCHVVMPRVDLRNLQRHVPLIS